MAHLDLNGFKDKNGLSYNPVLETKLNSLNFNYCAIGHIHKNNFNKHQKICYPGSTISLGFDEPGKHGMVVGELTQDNSLNLEFVPLDDREFEEIHLSVDDIYSEEMLIEKINALNLALPNFYKLNLIGNRNIEINTRKILRMVNANNLLKIKDCTKLNYNIEEIANQNNLKGYFVKEVIKQYKSGLCTEEEYQKALEIGLNSM